MLCLWPLDDHHSYFHIQYAPKDDQTPSLCATPPQSVCDSAYGLSIGRGSWTFAPGNWTTIRQDVWLNTPGQDDGGINVWINGRLAMSANDIRYRENANTCLNPLNADEELSDEAVASDLSPSPYMDEDWQPMLSSSTSIGAWPGTSISSTSEVPPSSMTALHVKQGLSAARAASAAPLALTGGSVQSVAAAASSAENTCNVGFIGLFFSTFFGGHTDDWASPKDQYSYFKDFSMWINS